MKILFLIDSFGCGGKERRLTELMKSLNARPEFKYELAVMDSDIYYKEVLDLNINIHYIIRKSKKDLSVFIKLYKLCKTFQPSILHCWDSMTAVYAAPVCKLLNIKFTNGMVCDTPVKLNIFDKVWLRAKLTFPLADAIIGNSKAGLVGYKVPKAKSVCVYNGFNFKRATKLVKSDAIREKLKIKTKYIIGMVASFSNNKDYKTYYIAAQAILKARKDITFIAIGNNTDSLKSKSYIENKYDSFFRLLGKKTNIESYINAMDICILSTFTEGISNSILEYMALGKPVIATKGGGTNEIIVDTVTGFLINPSKPNELSKKIEILLNDVALRIKMGKAGKERIQKDFTIDKMVNGIIAVYERLYPQN